MNIVFLIQDTGRLYGAQQATLDLAAGLREAGEQVRVLLMAETRLGRTEEDLRQALTAAGLPITVLPVAARFSPSLVRRVREELQRSEAEILHMVGYKADLHGAWAAAGGRRIPAVSTVHGWLFRPDRKERFYGWLNLYALRRLSRVITLSRYYEDLLLGFRIPRDRLVRIASGFDARPLAGVPAPSSPDPTFGLIGRLSWEKHQALFLHAARRALDRGLRARFLVAGEGPDRPALEQLVDRLQLRGAVELAGHLPREEFLARVHVVTLCSRIENLPYSVMEAMACGRPVLATEVGGLPDLVEHGRTGWLVPGDDLEALADAMRAASDAGERARRGEAGRQKLLREFAPARAIAAHQDLYRSLLR